MAQGLEPSCLETTCCVCASVEVPHKERRRVSRALAFTVLGQKLNEISQISLKLPGSAIVIVCKRCSDLIAKVEKLETELDATKGKIVQLVDQHAQRWQRRKRILSPSSAARALFSPARTDLSCEPENMPLAVPLDETLGITTQGT